MNDFRSGVLPIVISGDVDVDVQFMNGPSDVLENGVDAFVMGASGARDVPSTAKMSRRTFMVVW